MPVAGRQTVAMVDFDHAAIAAGPSGRRHFSVRGGAHRVTRCRPEIQARVHGRATEEGIAADPEAGCEFDFTDYGFSIWHQRKGPVEAIHLGTGDIDSVELALERASIRGKFYGNKGATHGRPRRRRFQFSNIKAEIVEYAAHPAHAGFHAVLNRA